MLQLVLVIGSAGTCIIWGDCIGSGLVRGADMNMCSPDCNDASISNEYICAPEAGGVRGAVGIVCVSLFLSFLFLLCILGARGGCGDARWMGRRLQGAGEREMGSEERRGEESFWSGLGRC